MTPCPSESQIDELLAGGLSDAEEQRLSKHLSGCESCRHLLNEKTAVPGSVRRALAPSTKDTDPQFDSLVEIVCGLSSVGTDSGVEHLTRDVDATLPVGEEPTVSLTLTLGGTAAQSGSARSAPPVELPGYEIIEEIGRGGLGVVFKARQLALDRLVALKMLLPHTFPGAEELTRFRLEAESVAKLQHPNVVQVFDVIDRGDNPCISMEYVEGGDLSARVGGDPQPPQAAVRCVEILARAMHAVHEAGILHRDLKPANVLLTASTDRDDGVFLTGQDGASEIVQPKITDFGIAKQMGEESGLTQTHAALGTPSYMSPEQAREGKTVTRAADVYSLGAILYKLLTGGPPFRGFSAVETMAQVIHEDPVPLRRLVSTIPPDLEAVCLKCLEKDPDRRYESAEALAEDLERVQDGRPTIARPITNTERVWRWCRRHQIAVILLVIAALAGLAIQRTMTERENATRAAEKVNGLRVADTTRVPDLVEDMAPYRKWADPLLTNSFEQSETGSRERLHAALALMSVDHSKVDCVRDQLHQVPPRHFPVLREALRPHQEKVTEYLWPLAKDEHVEPAHRFQAAAALAAFAPDDDRWNDVSPFVAQHLTTVAWPVEFGQWLQHFRPAREQLTDSLAILHADRSLSSRQREAAAHALADYWQQSPEKLIAVILIADAAAEFKPLTAALRPHATTVKAQLTSEILAALPQELSDSIPPHDPRIEQRDTYWKRQSIAAVTLVQLGLADDVWSLLKSNPDPSLRSFIIHHLGNLQTDPGVLVAQLQLESDASIRRALIQVLGGLDWTMLPTPDRDRLTRQLATLYTRDTDPGVHGSAAWALRKWGVPLPEVPVGEQAMLDAHQQRVGALEDEVAEIRKQLAAYRLDKSIVPQETREQQLREQPNSLPESLSEGLVAHYPLDNSEGASTANLVDGEPAGVYEGPGKPRWVAGIVDRALQLDGSGHVRGGRSFNPERTDAFSFGCWFFSESKHSFLLAKMDVENDYRGLDLGRGPDRFAIHLQHRFSTSNLALVTSVEPPPLRSWHHVFVTVDGSSSAAGIVLYMDGRLSQTRVVSDDLTDTISSDAPWTIGKRGTIGSFNGRIDDVRMYDRCLNEKEVQELFESGLRAVANVPAQNRTADQNALLAAAYGETDESLRELELQLSNAEKKLSDSRVGGQGWYVNSEGQTMIVIHSNTHREGGLNDAFAISSHEVTFADFRRSGLNFNLDPLIASTEDCPVHGVNWYMAAEYCNWLSEQDGIPEDQWVYEPNGEGKFAEGTQIKENFFELSGYRLPTESEWEQACRGGSSGDYGFGQPRALLPQYSHCVLSSSAQSRSVGSLLPNDFGLFDMHGNALEWTQDAESGPASPIQKDIPRVMRGGMFSDRPSNVRSDSRFPYHPVIKDVTYGFRVARSHR